MISQSYKLARRIVVGVVGATVVLLGMAMIVLPGPAFIVIPVGLAILGVEFTWARNRLRVLRAKVQSTFNARRRNSLAGAKHQYIITGAKHRYTIT
ncbi:MAG: PGPGW domain-containing protein [Gammaproteobacteria bacterium]